LQCDHDRLCNTGDIVQDVIVPEVQHAIACGSEECVALLVVDAFGVLRTVSLDDQAVCLTNEIRDIGSDRPLSPEFRATKCAIAQAGPESGLRLGG
jgi:hypothetical protein